jgi:RHS repeat-associated protein
MFEVQTKHALSYLGWPAVLAISICFVAAGASAQTASRPDRGLGTLSSYSLSDIENINLTNGNVQLNIPLASLPPLPGGRLKGGITAYYNSKNWDLMLKTKTQQGGYTKNIIQPAMSPSWSFNPMYSLLAIDRKQDFDNSATISPTDPNVNYIWKMVLFDPDGARHELRPPDLPDGTAAFAFGCYKDNPQSLNTTVRYYSFDGSYLYANIDPYPLGGGPTSWTVWQRDGTRISMNNGVQKIVDNNGNTVKMYQDINGTVTTTHVQEFVNHTVVREIDYIFDSSTNIGQVTYPTVGGVQETITINWGTTTVSHHYYPIGDPCEVNTELAGTIPVVRSIVLPQTEPAQAGLQYSFVYNSDQVDTTNFQETVACGFSPVTITSSPHGLGSLSQMTVPSGARVNYAYSLDGVYDVLQDLVTQSVSDIPGENVMGKTLTLTNPAETDQWTYGLTTTSAGVTGPDGSVMGESFFPTNPAEAVVFGGADGNGGLVYRTTYSNASGKVLKKVERHYTRLVFNGARDTMPDGFKATFNPVVDTEYTTLFDPTGTAGQLSTKSFLYDYNGNLIQESDYDWVDQAGVPRDQTTQVPIGIPPGAVLLRTINNTFYNASPAGNAPDPGSLNVYAKRQISFPSPPPLILNALKETTVGTSDTQLSFDNQSFGVAPTTGNLTLENRFDNLEGIWLGTSHSYDSSGNLQSTTDPLGHSVTFAYGDSTLGLPTSTTVNPGSGPQTSSVAYDSSTGLPTSKTDVNSNQTTIGYINNLLGSVDPFGRPATIVGPLVTSVINGQTFTNQQAKTLNYYYDSELQVVTASDLSTTGDGLLKNRTSYDQIHRVQLTESSENGSTYSIQSKSIYQSFGKITLVCNPTRNLGEATDGWIRTTNDEIGRTVEVATFSGAAQPPTSGTNSSWTGSVATVYSSNQTTVTDQAGKARKSLVDAIGRLTSVYEDPNGQNLQTSYSYDQLGNPTLVSQGSQTRTFTYDSLSRLRTAKNPEQVDTSGTQVATVYGYDNASNLQTKTNPNGTSISYTYDGMNRVKTKSLSTGQSYTFNYDTAVKGVGKLASVVTANGPDGYYYDQYDTMGRPIACHQTTLSTGYSTSQGYDLASHITSESYPSGTTITTTFDQAGRTNGVTGVVGGQSKTYVSSMSYTAHGETTAIKLGGAGVSLYENASYNGRLQPVTIGSGTSSADYSKLRLDYTYGTAQTANNGNVQTQTITVPGLTVAQSYTYDNLNRLTTAQEANGANWKQTFTYDRYGNRNFDLNNTTSNVLGPNPTIDQTTNRFSASQGYSYDTSGNLTAEPSKSYGYDAENHLVNFNNGSTTYTYDGDGLRVTKTTGASPTVFVYDVGGRLVAEYGGSQGTNSGTSYLITDHLSSTRLVTDSQGNVRARHDYLPFGEEISAGIGGRTTGQGYSVSDDTRQKFTSKGRDTESSLDYYGARYYSSPQGRFTSADSVAGFRSNPQSFNLYSYTLGNPLKYVDPTGHDAADADEEPEQPAQEKKKPKVVVVVFYGGNPFDSTHNTLKNVQPGGSTYGLGEEVIDAEAPHIAQKIANDFPDAEVKLAGPSMGDEVANQIKTESPDNIIIEGFSAGGKTAIDVSNNLTDSGQKVDLLITVDPRNPPFGSIGPVKNTNLVGEADNYIVRGDALFGPGNFVTGAHNRYIDDVIKPEKPTTPINHGTADDVSSRRVVGAIEQRLTQIYKK